MRNGNPPAAVHLDLDGARHIYRAHGWSYTAEDDPLFETGLQHALELFATAGIRATLFVIAEDLLNLRKRDLIRAAAGAGHEIASHSLTHRHLTKLESAEKRREIADSRLRLEAALGVEVRGFRAPGFSIDRECLDLIDEAGYRYDSSVLRGWFAGPADIVREVHPHRPLNGRPLLELPLPGARALPLPGHPSYSLVFGHWYFKMGLKDFRRNAAALVLLFHLTDFADPLPAGTLHGWKERLFTLSYIDAKRKRAKCAAMLEFAARYFTFMDTLELLGTSAARVLQHPLGITV